MQAAAHRSPLDDAIRAMPAAWFRPNRAIYWTDLLACAVAGWAAFVASIAARGGSRLLLLAAATALLYRAVLFIHEITHLARRDVPGFTVVWNAIVGVPLLVPSFLYEGVHNDHHRQRCYGTAADPEYVPFAHRSPTLIAVYMFGTALLPLALAIRFLVLAPVSWVVPSVRRATAAHASALVINTAYVRHAPIDRAGRVAEIAATAFAWAAGILWWIGIVPSAALWSWFAIAASASIVNGVRTLAAHRYDCDGAELTMIEQLLDSCNITPADGAIGTASAAARGLVAPLGLRYHALHHWIPSLPYHNLARAHRRLESTLRGDAPYLGTAHRGFVPLVADLVDRARTRAR